MTDREMLLNAMLMLGPASDVLRLGKEHGMEKQAITSLYIVARIITRDMREGATGWDEEKLNQLEAAVRLEMERIFIKGWTRQ